MKHIIVLFYILFVIVTQGYAQGETGISQQQALAIAEGAPEVIALYGLNNLAVNCLEKKVVRPCETDWVTCIDEAWVAEFLVAQSCLKHDGRMGVRLLISSVDGKIISRYPEVDYFNKNTYCMDQFDCFCNKKTDQCLNFIYGQFEGDFELCPGCSCKENACQMQGKVE